MRRRASEASSHAELDPTAFLSSNLVDEFKFNGEEEERDANVKREPSAVHTGLNAGEGEVRFEFDLRLALSKTRARNFVWEKPPATFAVFWRSRTAAAPLTIDGFKRESTSTSLLFYFDCFCTNTIGR